jgi:hypothetical protein
VVQEILQDLQLRNGFADLARPSDDDDGGKALLQTPLDVSHEMAASCRQGSLRLPFPPWIHPLEVPNQHFFQFQRAQQEQLVHFLPRRKLAFVDFILHLKPPRRNFDQVSVPKQFPFALFTVGRVGNGPA